MKKEIIEIIKKLLKIIIENGQLFIEIFKQSLNKKPFICSDIRIINDSILFSLWLLLILSLLWMIYEIFKNVYLYFQLTSYRYFKDGTTKFSDNPNFKQLENK